MATASYTWANWATPAWENLADLGLTANITYSKNVADVAAQFVSTTKGMASTREAASTSSSSTDTWETIFGIPAGSTVTAYQVTAWKRKLVSNALLSTISFNIGIVNVAVFASTVWISSASVSQGSVNVGGTSTSTDAVYTAQTAGASRTVDAAFQASNTPIRFWFDCLIATTNGAGSASVDCRITPVTITITYTTSSFNVGLATGATRGVLGTGVF